jgi:hypothetical protein
LLPVIAITLARGRQSADSPGEQLDLGDQRHATGHRRLNECFLDRHAGGNRDQINAGESLRGERTDAQIGSRYRGTQRVGLRRRRTTVGDAHVRVLPRQPAGHCQAAFAEADDEDQFAGKFHLSAVSGWTDRPAPA